MNCKECFHNPVCGLWREYKYQDANCHTVLKEDIRGCTFFVKADCLVQTVICKECLPNLNDFVKRKDVVGCLYNTLESYYIKRNIMDLPAADVKPVVRGKWIMPNNDDRPMPECSNCGWYVDIGGVNDFTYCPNCGARMKE